MHNQYAIRRHLSQSVEDEDGVTMLSGLTAVLRDARAATNRDPVTGAKLPNCLHISWLGSLGYMVLTDQIGTCFDLEGKESKYGGSFKRALALFSDLTESDIEALYALRCSLAHDFSLSAYDRFEAPAYLFRLVDGQHHQLVEHSEITWDGLYDVEQDKRTTTINVEKFADLVEKMLDSLCAMNEADRLRIRLRGGWYELLARYSIGFKRT